MSSTIASTTASTTATASTASTIATTTIVSITPWSSDVFYNTGHLVTYNHMKFRCIAPHVSKMTMKPQYEPLFWQYVPVLVVS